MTSKQRSFLKSLAMKEDAILQIGKGSISPELTESVREALEARELIKISILQNCLDDPMEMAQLLADRTGSEVVQIIGRKIVLFRAAPEDRRQIWLPGEKKPEKKPEKKSDGRPSRRSEKKPDGRIAGRSGSRSDRGAKPAARRRS